MTFKKFSIALVLTSATLSLFQSEEALGASGQTHSGQGMGQQSQTGGNQSAGQHHRRHQGSSGQHSASSQQTGTTPSPSSTNASQSSSSTSQSGTNKNPIELVYSGDHKGQKMVNGMNVEDPTIPVAHVTCGGKSFDISSTEKKLTIPAGTIPVVDGAYYDLGPDGKFIRTPTPPGYKTVSGKKMRCEYGTIGHGGFLGELSDKVNRIEIGETIADNKFAYGQ